MCTRKGCNEAPDKCHAITICNGAPHGCLLLHKAGDGPTVLVQYVQEYFSLQILHMTSHVSLLTHFALDACTGEHLMLDTTEGQNNKAVKDSKT